MASIVESHMDLSWDEDQPIREAEVVFLADKLVQENRFVGLAARFVRRMYDFALDSQAWDYARDRLGAARKIAERIEAVIGRSLDSLRDCSPVACAI